MRSSMMHNEKTKKKKNHRIRIGIWNGGKTMGKIMFENNDNISWGLYNQEMDFSVLYQEDTHSFYAVYRAKTVTFPSFS